MFVQCLFLVVVLEAFSTANGLQVSDFKDCGKKMVKINSAEITPCTEEPCNIFSGGDVTITVNFDAIQGADSLTASIFVDLDGAKHPYPISMHDDACEGTGLSCPLSAGETYTYVEHISVPRYIKSPARSPFTLGLELINEEGEDYLCVMADVMIKSPTRRTEA